MIKLLLLLVLLTLPALGQIPAGLPIVNDNGKSSGLTCAYPGGVHSGNILIASLNSFSAITLTAGATTDTVGTTYGAAQESSTGSALFTAVFVGVAGGTGANTVTFTGTNNFNNVNCVALDQNLYTATVDGTAHTNGVFSGTPASFTTASVTPTVNQDFFYVFAGGFSSSGQLTPVLPLNWLAKSAGADSAGAGYLITGTSGSGVTATFNNTTNSKGNYVVITLKPVAMTIAATTMPTGSLGNAYDWTPPIVGGAGARTWSITSGTLPYGLSQNTTTGEISGTPISGPTSSSITISATDGTNTANATLTLTINASASTPTHIGGAATGVGSTIGLTSVSIGDIIDVEVFLGCNTSSFILPPTDTLSTVYHFVGAIAAPSGGSGCFLEIAKYVGQATSSGADTITPQTTPAVASQFSNVQPFYDTSIFTSGKSAATATITSSNLTTLVPNSMVQDGADIFSGSTSNLTAISPFTSSTVQGGAGPKIGSEYNVEASVGTYAPSWTQANNTDGDWAMGAIALRPTTSGTVRSPSRISSQVY